jgi:hypothetical protein
MEDYGHNGRAPDGLYTMHPSGDRVTKEECDRRLAKSRSRPKPVNDCLGLSWDEIERKQGGKLNRNA